MESSILFHFSATQSNHFAYNTKKGACDDRGKSKNSRGFTGKLGEGTFPSLVPCGVERRAHCSGQGKRRALGFWGGGKGCSAVEKTQDMEES